jgi:hypothetical protein
MLPASTEGTCEGRTAVTNQTVRTVFVVGPDKKVKLMIVYPMTTGRNFDEVEQLEVVAMSHVVAGLHEPRWERRSDRFSHHLAPPTSNSTWHFALGT